MDLPEEVIQYLQRMEAAILNANNAMNLLKTENEELKRKLSAFEKGSSQIVEVKRRKVAGPSHPHPLRQAPVGWAGIDGFLSTETGNDQDAMSVHASSKSKPEAHSSAGSSKVPSRSRSRSRSSSGDMRLDMRSQPSSSAVGDLFGETSSDSDDSDDSDGSDGVAALEAAVKPHQGFEVVSSATVFLTEEEQALRATQRVKILFSKLTASTVASVGEQIKNIAFSTTATIFSGFIECLLKKVSAEGSSWLTAERLNQAGFNREALVPKSLATSMEDLSALFVYIATSDSQGFRLAVSTLKLLANKVKAMAKSMRSGNAILWTYLGSEASMTSRVVEQLSSTSSTTASTSGASVSNSNTKKTDRKKVKSGAGDKSADRSEEIADGNGEPDDNDAFDDDDGAEDEHHEDEEVIESDSVGASYSILMIFLCEVMLRLGAVDLLKDFFSEIVAITSASASFEELCAVILSMKSFGSKFLRFYKDDMTEILQSLMVSLGTCTLREYDIALFSKAIGNLATSVGEKIPSSISKSVNSLDASVSVLLSCLETESDSVSYTSKFNSCASRVVYEIRRFGVLRSVQMIDVALRRIYSTAADNASFLDACGLTNFDKYLLKLLEVAGSYSKIVFSESTESSESLASVVFRNPFECSDLKIDHTSDMHYIRKNVRIYFQNFWRMSLPNRTSLNVRYSLIFLKLIIRAILIDYLPGLGVWQMGQGGNGQPILPVIKEHLKNTAPLMELIGLPPSSRLHMKTGTGASTTDLDALWFMNLAPVTSISTLDTLKESITFVDNFVANFSSSEIEEKCVSPDQKRNLAKLLNLVSDVTSLVMTNITERLLFLAMCSAGGFIDATHQIIALSTPSVGASRSRSSSSRSSSANSLSNVEKSRIGLLDSYHLLREIPSPWNVCSHSESFLDHIRLSGTFMTQHQRLPQELVSTIQRLTSKYPAFVLNLDRRHDRWQRILTMCEKNGLLAIRVPAIDGTITTKGSRTRSINVDASDDACVLKMWDTTLNSKYDPTVLLDSQTLLTSSERACAKSHVNIWRAIFTSSPSSFAPDLPLTEILSWRKYTFSSTSTGARSKNDLQEWYLILEDDAAARLDPTNQAQSDDNIVWAINSAIQALPIDADILYLGHQIPKKASYNPTKDKKFFRPNYVTQLHSYMITKKTAGVLLSFLPVDCPVDIFLARLIHDKIITAYALKVQLFKQKLMKTNNKLVNDSDVKHSGRF